MKAVIHRIAKTLFQKVKDRCNAEKNFSVIAVNAPPNVAEVDRRLGFVETKELIVKGIRFTPMTYPLKKGLKEMLP